MGFGADMDRFKNKTVSRSKQAVEYICFNMSNQIITLTPVDTGAAKNNWQASIGSPNRSAKNDTDKNGSGSRSDANSTSKKAYGNIYYFVNSLPYIKRLENGWSKQAASGMVMITVSRFRNVFKKAIR